MWNPFKRTFQADLVGAGLAEIVWDQMEPEEIRKFVGALEDQGLDDDQVNHINHEIMYLKVFAVDFAVSSVLQTQQKREVLDAFYLMCFKGALKRSEEVTRGVLKGHEEDIKSRLWDYANAVKTEHQMGYGWTVSCAFAKWCGFPDHPALITMGTSVFGNTSNAVAKMLKSIVVK
ncbi:MAG: hypothetical protein HYX75_10465 [Acidobacteria bacterium]|nr:hypothetical protein [Acidobacteriota bacterium]